MRRTKATVAVLLGAVCLAVFGVACGDDGGSKKAKAEYLDKAKAVCEQGRQTLEKASNEILAKVPAGQKLSDQQIEEFVRSTVVPTIRDQVKQLRAIPPPKGEAGHVEEVYAGLDRGLDELEKSPAKLSDGSNVFADADKLAQKYGISVCATPTG